MGDRAVRIPGPLRSAPRGVAEAAGTAKEDSMTTAEMIAAEFDNDGQKWENASMEALGDYVTPYADEIDERGDGAYRVQFTDGSALILTPEGWDIGFSAPATCYCGQVDGHRCVRFNADPTDPIASGRGLSRRQLRAENLANLKDLVNRSEQLAAENDALRARVANLEEELASWRGGDAVSRLEFDDLRAKLAEADDEVARMSDIACRRADRITQLGDALAALRAKEEAREACEVTIPKWAAFDPTDYQDPPQTEDEWATLDYQSALDEPECLVEQVVAHRYEIVALRARVAELETRLAALRTKLAEAREKFDEDFTAERKSYADLVERIVNTAVEAGFDVPVNGVTASTAACWMRDQLAALRAKEEERMKALRGAVDVLCSCGGFGADTPEACNACRTFLSVRVVQAEGGGE